MKLSAFIATTSVALTCLGLASTTRADDKENAAAKTQPITITGCLNGPYDDGAFKLETSAEKVMIGGPIDVLRENAGKQVRVTGDWIATGEGKSGAASREGESPKERAFKADKIEMIAADCSNVQ
jgi:hypothetical protein